nr:ubiquitin hydrolase [Tanacetum cinerariifolium]
STVTRWVTSQESAEHPEVRKEEGKKAIRQGSKAKEKSSKALMAIDGMGWDWSYMANKEDHALAADEETPTEFALMANIENKSQRSKKVKEGVGYNAVPPPAADLYLSPKKDLSWTGLPEFMDDTDVASPNTPKPFVKFVKPKDSQPESKSKEQETPKKSQVKYPEQNRHSNKRPKGNQRNWNNLKSYQLGPEFVLHKKPCFNCGDFSHLANDCRRRVQRETNRSQNHSYKSSTHRSAGHRPNGAHMRPPLKSSGPRPHGDSMRPSFRHAPSYETRPFLKSSAVKNPYRAPWVPTVNRYDPPVNRKFSTGRRNFPTANRKFPTASRKFTTGSTKYHTADMGIREKLAVKATLMTKVIGTVAALGT